MFRVDVEGSSCSAPVGEWGLLESLVDLCVEICMFMASLSSANGWSACLAYFAYIWFVVEVQEVSVKLQERVVR